MHAIAIHYSITTSPALTKASDVLQQWQQKLVILFGLSKIVRLLD